MAIKLDETMRAALTGPERVDLQLAVAKMIELLGDNPHRSGMQETPARYIKAMEHYTGGYRINPATLLKEFDDGAENYNQMITVKGIPFWSLCEHHLAPFFGEAVIAYVPNNKIVGLSKLARVVDAYARRFQVQERMTHQIADMLFQVLKPKGVGVMLSCRHSCMESRGIQKAGCVTVTTALKGCMLNEDSARNEFLEMARSPK